MAQVIIQKGGAAGGRMECDGKKHRWVYAEYKAFGLPEVVPMGRCNNPQACQQMAAALIQQEKEAAEKAAAKAAAVTQVKPASPTPVKEG